MISDVSPTPEGWLVVAKPAKGQAMLACRCGAAMGASQMRKLVPPRRTATTSVVIHRIVCPLCEAAYRKLSRRSSAREAWWTS